MNIPSLAPPVASPVPLPAVGGPAVGRGGVGIGAAQRGPRSRGCTRSVSRPRARATPGKGTRISRGLSSWGSPPPGREKSPGLLETLPGAGKNFGHPSKNALAPPATRDMPPRPHPSPLRRRGGPAEALTPSIQRRVPASQTLHTGITRGPFKTATARLPPSDVVTSSVQGVTPPRVVPRTPAQVIPTCGKVRGPTTGVFRGQALTRVLMSMEQREGGAGFQGRGTNVSASSDRSET